ncbi:M10 family metallopeptidase C-terminal domain-containing protein [Pseudomonas fluorescens]
MIRASQPSVPTQYESVQQILEQNKRGHEPKSEGGEPSLTSQQVADRLNRLGSRWVDSNRNGKTELTYEFTSAEPNDFADVKADNPLSKFQNVVPLSLRQREIIRQAHQDFADVTNVTFTEKTDGTGEGHLTYRGYNTGDQTSEVLGVSYYPDAPDQDRQGTIWLRHLDQTSKFGGWLDKDKHRDREPYWRSTMIHELGHALGLQHPGSDEGEQPVLPDYEEDWTSYTVMSGYIPVLNEAKESVEPSSLMIDDIQAMQSKYGANYSTRNGNTTYGFNSNTDREHYSLKTPQDKPLFSVWDGGGWDTLDFSEFDQDQTINLNAGSMSSVGGLRNNVSIANGVTVEEARGGKGKNILIGNNVFNILRGGQDDDTLYGGSGGAQMWGGKGANTFVFDTQSTGKPNWVMDFVSSKDKLDFSGLSQQLGSLNFVSNLPLDHSKPQDPLNPTFISKPGDVIVNYDQDFKRTSFRLDTTGDGRMDVRIDVHGSVAREDIVV